MSWINVAEVAYVLERRVGADQAHDVVRGPGPLSRLDLPTEVPLLDAARIKARHRMADADSFAVAKSLAPGAQVRTGDPEILEADDTWSLMDIRRP